jgi:hypothetical protein
MVADEKGSVAVIGRGQTVGCSTVKPLKPPAEMEWRSRSLLDDLGSIGLKLGKEKARSGMMQSGPDRSRRPRNRDSPEILESFIHSIILSGQSIRNQNLSTDYFQPTQTD